MFGLALTEQGIPLAKANNVRALTRAGANDACVSNALTAQDTGEGGYKQPLTIPAVNKPLTRRSR